MSIIPEAANPVGPELNSDELVFYEVNIRVMVLCLSYLCHVVQESHSLSEMSCDELYF